MMKKLSRCALRPAQPTLGFTPLSVSRRVHGCCAYGRGPTAYAFGVARFAIARRASGGAVASLGSRHSARRLGARAHTTYRIYTNQYDSRSGSEPRGTRLHRADASTDARG